MRDRLKLLQNPYLIAFLLILSFWFIFLLTSDSFLDGYHFQDDHEIALIHYQLEGEGKSIWQTISEWIKADRAGGRFRPFYYTNRIFLTKIFGFNLFAFSVYNLFVATFSTLFFFISAQLLSRTFIESLLFSFLITLGPQSEIWWWLGPSEIIGTFLLSISLICLILSIQFPNQKINWDISLIFLFILMSLVKESFIVLAPSLIFMQVWLFQQKNNVSWFYSLKSNLLTTFTLSIISVVEVFYISKFVKISDSGYHGIQSSQFLDTFNQITNYFSFPLLFLTCCLWLISFAVSPQNITRETQKKILALSILIALIVVPQVTLYSSGGITSERYLIPSILGCAILVTSVAACLRGRSKILYFLLLLLIASNLSFKTYNVWNDAYLFSNKGRTITSFFQFIEANTQPESKIVVVANAIGHSQWAISVKRYLSYIANRENLYLLSYEEANIGGRYAYLDPELLLRIYGNKTIDDIQNKSEIDCVIVATGLNQQFLQDSNSWFNPNRFQEQVFHSIAENNSYFRHRVYSN